jgi:hypothetical protein
MRAALRCLLPAALLTWGLAPAAAAQAVEAQYWARHRLPPWVAGLVAAPGFSSRYELDLTRNPFYVTGDFDADGRSDIAILVRPKGELLQGIAIFRRAASAPAILGAGTSFGNGGPDYRWMDLWRVEERGHNPDLPPGRGDVLWVEKSESASASIHWDGTAWQWTQFGD